MKIIKRLAAFVVAAGLLGCVIYLGILSDKDAKYVAWFGIAAAIAAPIGLSLVGYVFSRHSDAELVEQLARVPEVDRLMHEAKTQEQKIRVLQDERARIAEVVKLEARRQAVGDRIESLKREGTRILEELESLEAERNTLEQSAKASPVSEEIEGLRQRVRARQRGDVFIRLGTHEYRLSREVMAYVPYGSILIGAIQLSDRFVRWFARMRASRKEPE